MFKAHDRATVLNVQVRYAGHVSDTSSEEPRWLTDDQLDSWRSVMAMLMTLPAALDTQLKRDAGMNTFEYHILVGLAARPEAAMSMGELALITQGSPSRLSHAVARLERAGWIERRSGTARCVNAHLTAAGRQKLVDSAPGHVREVRRLVIDAMPPEELRTLGDAAQAVATQADPALMCALVRRDGDDTCDEESGPAPDHACDQAQAEPSSGR